MARFKVGDAARDPDYVKPESRLSATAQASIQAASARATEAEEAGFKTTSRYKPSFKGGGDGPATEPTVVSTKQGEKFFSDLQSKLKRSGLGTEESPLTDIQIEDLEKQGITEGDTVPGKGILTPKGTFRDAEATETKPEPTATYVNPETGQEITTSGTQAGSEDEQNTMKGKGYDFAEGTARADETESPELTKAREAYESAVSEVEKLKNKLNDLFITDKEMKAEILAISKSYDARIAEMQDINKRQVGKIQTLGVRSGARYTGGGGGLWGGIISEAERQGVLRIADIESQRQTKIIEAKTAIRNFNYAVAADLMDAAETLSTQKANELADLKKAQKEQDEAIAEQKRSLAVDDAVVQAVQDGMTTVGAMFDYINYDSNGNLIGDVSLAEIDKAFKVANPSSDLADLDGDMADWEYLKSIGDPWGDLSYGEFVRAVGNAKRAPTTSETGGDYMSKILSVSEIDDLKGMYPDYKDQINYGMTRQQVADIVGGDVSKEDTSGEEAENTAYEAEGYLRNEIDLKVLKRIADAEGISSWLKHKVVDVNNMFEKASDADIIALANLFKEYSDKTDSIITLLEEGDTPDDILNFLKESE